MLLKQCAAFYLKWRKNESQLQTTDVFHLQKEFIGNAMATTPCAFCLFCHLLVPLIIFFYDFLLSPTHKKNIKELCSPYIKVWLGNSESTLGEVLKCFDEQRTGFKSKKIGSVPYRAVILSERSRVNYRLLIFCTSHSRFSDIVKFIHM